MLYKQKKWKCFNQTIIFQTFFDENLKCKKNRVQEKVFVESKWLHHFIAQNDILLMLSKKLLERHISRDWKIPQNKRTATRKHPIFRDLHYYSAIRLCRRQQEQQQQQKMISNNAIGIHAQREREIRAHTMGIENNSNNRTGLTVNDPFREMFDPCENDSIMYENTFHAIM